MHNGFRDGSSPLAQIREWEADQEVQQARLEHAVENLGLKGLYFAVEALAFTNWVDHLDDVKFEPLWETVRRLDIPVFLVPLHKSQGSVPQLPGTGRAAGPVGQGTSGYSLRFHPRHREHRHAATRRALRYSG